jgi:hypothetical protein
VQSATLIEPMASSLAAFQKGEIQTYGDVINRSK